MLSFYMFLLHKLVDELGFVSDVWGILSDAMNLVEQLNYLHIYIHIMLIALSL